MVTSNNKFISGFRKFVFFQYLKIYVFLVYTKRLILGEFNIRVYFIFIKRALLFLSKVTVNKVVKTRGVYKIHIYFPAFPTKAFFIALDKFLLLKEDKIKPYPTSVLLSMTKACNYKCRHCYQKKDILKDIPINKLINLTKQIQDLKISFINIEGGEPLLKFDRLMDMLKSIDGRSEVWVNTTGFSLTEEKAKKMKEAEVFGIMASLHHWDRKKHDDFVGEKGAYDIALNALKIFSKAGISTAINCTGTQELIQEDGFENIMEIAKNNKVAIVQLIHEKPAGAWISKKDTLNKEYVKKLYDIHLKYNTSSKYKDYPAVSSQVFESSENNFGCTAGGIERFYVNANGDVQACEFVNLSFGNINEEPFIDIYNRMRKTFNKPRTKWICCIEHEKIQNALKKSTPISKKESNRIFQNFDLGKETGLYKKMKLYD
ncbi:MAG: radical SAM protein [Nanoarchaeota archaeon]|nr:radical SAM protein [Nanoarchaeota archaeon]